MPQQRFNFSAFEGFLVEQGISPSDLAQHRSLAQQFLTYHQRKPVSELRPADVDRFVRDLMEAQASAGHVAAAKRAATEVLSFLASIRTGNASPAKLTGGHVGVDPLKARAKRFTGQQRAIGHHGQLPHDPPSNPFAEAATGAKAASFTGPRRAVTSDPRASASKPAEKLHPYFTGEHSFVPPDEVDEELHPFFSGEHGAVSATPVSAMSAAGAQRQSHRSGDHTAAHKSGVRRQLQPSGGHRVAQPSGSHRAALPSGGRRAAQSSGRHPVLTPSGAHPVLPQQPMVPEPPPLRERIDKTHSDARFVIVAVVIVLLLAIVAVFVLM